MATVRAFAPPPQRRRIEICRTAAQIFRDRGFDATSVSDVARALGMTKAGLYHYFESKEALLFEIMTYGLDRVRRSEERRVGKEWRSWWEGCDGEEKICC